MSALKQEKGQLLAGSSGAGKKSDRQAAVVGVKPIHPDGRMSALEQEKGQLFAGSRSRAGNKSDRQAGVKPINLAEYEEIAKGKLNRNAYDYYASGANDMITLRENRSAYSRLRIVPRCLVGVADITTEVEILGSKISMPICVAPTAMQRMANDEGELATARAAARHGTLMGLSSWATTSLEDVAEASTLAANETLMEELNCGGCGSSSSSAYYSNASKCDGLRWFQLYVYKDREVTLQLVRRAEAAGYLALAVTVDTPILGRREPDIHNKFQLPAHLTMANFTAVGGKHSTGTQSAGNEGSGLASYVAELLDRSLNWDTISWLRENTKLKIVVKGIMCAEDAILACEHGVDGIWVSNHGARQVDTAPATIEMLPEIARAVNDFKQNPRRGGAAFNCTGTVVVPEVYVDGGIMRGTDVFKALACGARAVFIGRPVLWGLAHSGEEGVYDVLKLLREELVLAMQLSGTPTLRDIVPSFIRTTAPPLGRIDL